MNTETILPIFEHNKERYGIIFVNGYEPNYMNKFKYFNLNIPLMLKKRVEKKSFIHSDFFTFNPEKILFDGTSIDYKLIMFCKSSLNINNSHSHSDECTSYCKCIQDYFGDHICKIYVDIELLLNDYPEAIYIQDLAENILSDVQSPIANYCSSPSDSIDQNPSKIYENLYLGAVYHSTDEKFIKQKNIKHILSLLEHPCELSKNPDFTYIKFKHIDVCDKLSSNISDYFSECIDFIKNAHSQNEIVYVHCAMGISRSVSIVIAYLIQEKNMNFEAAFNYVKSCRPQADPNIGFTCQLMEFERKLQK